MTSEQLEQLAQSLKARAEPHALVTVVRAIAPTSAYVGAQAIVDGDGVLHGWIGGGCAKRVVVAAATQALASGLPKLVRIGNEQLSDEQGIEQHPMRCASNGTIELFIQPMIERPGLCVLGATPAADEARFLAERMGIVLTAAVDAAPIVLVATQGEGDEAALAAALACAAPHVLMIASRAKAARLRAAMLGRGFAAQRVEAIESPVGPDIGASTPAEIALAAIAQVVRLRRARDAAAERASAMTAAAERVSAEAGAAGTRRVETGAAGTPLAETGAADIAHAESGAAGAVPPPGYVNPVCGAPISAAMVLHVRAHRGIAQFFCCDHCTAEFDRDPDKYTAIARSAARA